MFFYHNASCTILVNKQLLLKLLLIFLVILYGRPITKLLSTTLTDNVEMHGTGTVTGTRK